MDNNNIIKMCVARSLPVELEPQARRLASEINVANAARTGVVTLNKLWAPGTTLTVAFIDGVPEQHTRVQPYFLEWTRYANLKFVFILNKWNADIRVSFREGEGSWSVVGTDALLVPKDEPSMVLGWLTVDTEEKEVKRVTLHEVGHAIGFEHELETPDKAGPAYDEEKIIKHYAQPPHSWSPEETRRQILSKLSPEGRRFTPFDQDSIMCYSVPASFTKNGRGTPWNTELSPTDKMLVKKVYPANV